MNKKLTKKVKKSFKEHFKTKSLQVFSPGRINFIGEHTDYNDGFVFPAAINKGIALAIQKTDASSSKVFALNREEMYAFIISEIQPLDKGGWRNYILGVVSEIKKLGIKVGNFNAVFAGNIPAGAGLSSSAALENAFVYGLNELFSLGLSKQDMILISQKAEHNYVGVQCGIMDQYASMFGVKKSALLLDCRMVEAKIYTIDFKKYRLLLLNSNVQHELSESAYNDRRTVCETISKKMNVIALRDATKENLEGIRKEVSAEDFQKALYVIEENQRVQSFAKAIKKNKLKKMGKLMYASHAGLSEQYKVSCQELDFLVDRAKENQNVLGARMMGGGFGGCTINLVLKSAAEDFEKEVSSAFLNEFGKSCSVYQVKLSKGTQISK